jgi:hypothetical protein
MTRHYENAVEIATNNESGAAICQLADRVQLLVSDCGETFVIWDYRPNAKRIEKRVSAAWAYKFLGRAIGVTVRSYEW